MIMMVLLSRSATENRLTRTQWDPGKSLFEKIVKTSWDVHLNPGPPERIGPHSLTVEEFDLSKYEEQHGIREGGVYTFEIRPTTKTKQSEKKKKWPYSAVCTAKLCTAEQRLYEDWNAFLDHCRQHHKIVVEYD